MKQFPSEAKLGKAACRKLAAQHYLHGVDISRDDANHTCKGSSPDGSHSRNVYRLYDMVRNVLGDVWMITMPLLHEKPRE